MTMIVNLFGGPGTGKSTTAAGLFYKLKSAGINCEYVQEYAKDKTWQDDMFTLTCQPYITGKQLYRQHRLIGKVDVVVTDSPIILGSVYGGAYTGPAFDQWLLEAFNSFDNTNIFLNRDLTNHPYNQAGRSQTLEEAIKVDEVTQKLLDNYQIGYKKVNVGPYAVDDIYRLLYGRLFN